jgi:regulatory protein YycI of two-component signal transduction system YycFG
MKKILIFVLAITVAVNCYTQKTTGLSPVFKITDPSDSYKRLYGYIDETGKQIVPFIYDDAEDFKEGYSRVVKDEKYGFVDESGKLVFACEYDYAENFKNGLARVQRGDNYFYLDARGIEHNDKSSTNNFNKIVVNERFGFTDKSGELIIPADYTNYEIIENYVVCRNDELRHVYDSTGKLLLETGYSIYSITDDLFFFTNDGKYGVMDMAENVLFETENGFLYHYFADYFYSTKNSEIIYYDKSGKIIEKPLKKNATAFIESEIVNGNYMAKIYDSNGKLLKTYDYDDGPEGDDLKFINGLARIHLSKEDKTSKDKNVRDWGGVQAVYVNMKGEIVWKSNIFYSCFPADAMITMADGTQKKICEIEAGDFILSYDPASSLFSSVAVDEKISHNGKFDMVEITVINAENYLAGLQYLPSSEIKINATPNHPVYTNEGIKIVSNLEEGDQIISINQEEKILTGTIHKSKHINSKAEKVYNLRTNNHPYFVNGVLVMMK